ncbi:energy-coupling factor transport system ATP-binding protein [Paenibacillus phyllosphaerae]|uniref:Energy-coupling factor transport system ATP-binding protein n=1 Tax=Paenibacillus phyllosphaerae TaxID=274593 RepID=A0A7W5B3B7_9BACL|nr:ABC transporter ATP-binding protein [Paenibacillus phyllosphaerae]MBB3113558.1 energy-coupling factor transport system ATP-binding protein [Paenibacillus phyllosphaerae]
MNVTQANTNIDSAICLEGVKVISGNDRESAVASRLDINQLAITRGEWVYLAGINGSGKSTLARLLAGLSMEGVHGVIDRGFAGEFPAPYVMQQPDSQLFGQTPREELSFVLEWLGLAPDEVERQAAAVLHRFRLAALADEPWEHLSGGQRQLTAVAAAVAGNAPLIVLDEATSMLDDHARELVREVAFELHREGTAIVWVTQRLEELEPDRRVIAMHHGRIAYDGETRQFLYGTGDGVSPCLACGLRLPYMAAVAMEMFRQNKLAYPLPMSMTEWRGALG